MSEPGSERQALRNLWNPVVLIAGSILVSVFILIGAAIAGWDKGVLINMGRPEFARGLITYLFAVVTIGTAVVLVVSALSGPYSDEADKRFQRGKEVLSLLLGVFGTIVGFYFGAETRAAKLETAALRLSPPLLSQSRAISGQRVTVTGVASGGALPYRASISIGDKANAEQPVVREGGWIVQEVEVPQVKAEIALTVGMAVTDAEGQTVRGASRLQVEPQAPQR